MPSSGGQKCALDRKSTRLNSSHGSISYAVFCLKNNNIYGRKVQVLEEADSQAGHPRLNMKVQSWELPAGVYFFFFNDTATTEIYTLSLHDALPISTGSRRSTGFLTRRGATSRSWSA